MEVFTIIANEVIGLSATECTLIQFSYNPEQIRDPETVLRSAIKDYLKTDEGKRQLEINCGCWNWGDVDETPRTSGSSENTSRTKKITPPSTTVCRCTLNIACLWILIQRKSLAQVLIGAAML